MKTKKSKSVKRLLCIATASAVVAASGIVASAASENYVAKNDYSQSDIADYADWANGSLWKFADNDWLKGYSTNVYAPADYMTRSQFAAFVIRVKGLTGTADLSEFTDMADKTEEWYYETMQIAVANGLLKGCGDGTLQPESTISRSEAIAIVARMYGEEDGTVEDLKNGNISDIDEMQDWQILSGGAMVREGLILGSKHDDGNLYMDPAKPMSRVEGVVMLDRVLEATEEEVYVQMNIPYSALYGDEKIDAYTSATTSKTLNGTLGAGSYHVNSDGTDITGASIPVKLGEGVTLDDIKALGGKEYTDDSTLTLTTNNRGKETTTTYTGADALLEAPTYSYYVMSTTPSVYVEVTKDSDGNLVYSEVQGETTQVEGGLKLTTGGHHTYYTIDNASLSEDFSLGTDKIYGAVITTTEGKSYGMRHVINLWRGIELGWQNQQCTDETDSTVYDEMQGKYIASVTYYTSKGIYQVKSTEENGTYVPIKPTGDVEVADVTDAKSTTITSTLPEDYNATYSVEDMDGEKVENGTLSWDSAMPGSYTLVVSDANGKYADVEVEFTVSTDAMPAAYDSNKIAVVKAADAADADYSNFLSNISKVNVKESGAEGDGTDYSATGRNATKIVKEDGTIDTSLDIFEAGKTYELTITSEGYTKTVTGSFFYEGATKTVMLNIPYADFYAAISTDSDVDTVSSATDSKWQRQSGTYYQAAETGGTILGVTYPVQATEYVLSQLKAKDDTSYSYTEADEGTTALMTATIENGTIKLTSTAGDATAVTATTSMLYTTNYGDYQINVDGFSLADGETLYGVVLNTNDGAQYGLRALENIWKSGTQLAWSVGIVTRDEHHGNDLKYADYTDMVGKTITSIDYYTSSGVKTVTCSLPVLEQSKVTVSAADALVSTGRTTFTLKGTLPNDYNAVYTVANGITASADGTITWDTTNAPAIGQYTLTVSDSNNKYAPFSTTFTLQTDAMPAAYDATDVKLVAAENYTAEDLSAYLKAITSVKVGDNTYRASGKGATTIINSETGVVDTSVTSKDKSGNETAIFEAGKTYTVTVTATGYAKALEFTVSIPAVKTVTANVNCDDQPATEYRDEWDDYDQALDVTIKDGAIVSIAMNGDSVPTESKKYFNWAINGTGSVQGLATTLVGKTASEIDTVDSVSGATVASNAIKAAAKAALQ